MHRPSRPLALNHIDMDFIDASPTGQENESETNSQTALPDMELIENIGGILEQEHLISVDRPPYPASKRYPMNGTHRGKVLIYNNKTYDDDEKYPDREGTEKDEERLIDSLQRLGFRREDIRVFNDKTVSEIEREAKKLEADQDLEHSDCLMVVILTHGEEGDFLMASDHRYHLYEFIEHFTPTKLKSMAGKPKIFIVQACRGSKNDRGVLLRARGLQNKYAKDNADSTSSTYTFQKSADMLVIMSSHHGHFSFRNQATGSWLIQEFCNVIDRCDLETCTIYDILTETNDAVSKRISDVTDAKYDKKKQISSFYSTLTKQLYFKPKPNVA
ncbi:caspase-6-like [Malaya genurostris]|uniref:caspase-6-like n=1 Tax=Malaya genurostris TaxID=325434 RepID=UPI0026F3CFC5|nr:caspase-6-like [Malaya genurostris]